MKITNCKRIISTLLCVLLLFSCVPLSANAYSTSLAYGDGWRYDYNTGIMSVSKSWAVTLVGANQYQPNGSPGSYYGAKTLALAEGVSIRGNGIEVKNLGQFKGTEVTVRSKFNLDNWPSIGTVSSLIVERGGNITGGTYNSGFLTPTSAIVRSGGRISGGEFNCNVTLEAGSAVDGGSFTGVVYSGDDSLDNNFFLRDANVIKGILKSVTATGDLSIGSTLTASIDISPASVSNKVVCSWYCGGEFMGSGTTCKIPKNATGKPIYVYASHTNQSVNYYVGTIAGNVDYKNETAEIDLSKVQLKSDLYQDIINWNTWYYREAGSSSCNYIDSYNYENSGTKKISVGAYTGKTIEYFIGKLNFGQPPEIVSNIASIYIPSRPKYIGGSASSFLVETNSNKKTISVIPADSGNYEYIVVVLPENFDDPVVFPDLLPQIKFTNGNVTITDDMVKTIKGWGGDNVLKLYVRNPAKHNAFGSEWQYISTIEFCKHENSEQKYVDNKDETHSLVYSCCGEVISTEKHSGTVATCTELAKCSECLVSYGSKNPNNHSDTKLYYQFKNDTSHNVYYSCCNQLKETLNHSDSSPANCKDISYCDICETSFGTTNLDNHAGTLSYIDFGKGTHVQKWSCCGDVEGVAEKHNFVYTVNKDAHTISASCSDCGNKGSVELVLPSELTYSGYSKEANVVGKIDGVDLPSITYKQGETELESAPIKAGAYTASITLGDATLECEFTIEPKELTLEQIKVDSKYFDGTKDLEILKVSINGVVCYDEKTPWTDYDDVCDDVSVDLSVLNVILPDSVPGDYPILPVSNIVLLGEDKENYTIASSIDEVNIVDYFGYEFYIRNSTLNITPENQFLVGDQELDMSKCTVEGLRNGHIASGITVEADDYGCIYVNTDNLVIEYNGEDVTQYYDINTYSAYLSWVCDNHSFTEEGFCPNCDGYETPMKVLEYDEYDNPIEVHEIKNAGNLYWFAEQANKYDSYISCKLVNDINVNPDYKFNSDGTYTGGTSPRVWTPIGNANTYRPYCGYFDGNGYTISGLYVNTPKSGYAGMFGYTDYGNIIKNVNISNSYFCGYSYVGALVASAGTYFENCSVDETVTVAGAYSGSDVGGLIGYISYGVIKNCYSLANIVSEAGAGIVGLSYAQIENCYTNHSQIASIDRGSIENCYYLSDENNANGGKTEAQFASGEVAYLLQGEQTEKVWGQTIHVDSYPTFTGSNVNKVANCKGEDAYSNTYEIIHFNELLEGKAPTCTENGLSVGVKCSSCGQAIIEQDTIPATGKHNYENGVCTGCGGAEPTETPTEKPTEKPTETPSSPTDPVIKTDGYYVTGDINLKLTASGTGKVRGTIALQAGTYNIKLNNYGTLLGYGKKFTDTTNGLTFKSTYGSYCTLVATGGTYTFQVNLDKNTLVVKHDSNLPEEYLVGDINTILSPVAGKPLAIGTTYLEAGTYKFKISDNATLLGNGNSCADDTAGRSITFKSNYNSYYTLNATGGNYTFTYYTSTNKLIIKHSPVKDEALDDVHLSGEINLVLDDNNGESNIATGTVKLTDGTYAFKVYNYGQALTVGAKVTDNGLKKLFGNYSTPLTLIASGGTYTFSFNKLTNEITIEKI